MTQDVKVPTLGESVTEATVGEWLKQPGDAVAMDEPIVSLETDKVAVEVPSPVAGVLGKLTVEIGDTVEVGAVIGALHSPGAPQHSLKRAARRGCTAGSAPGAPLIAPRRPHDSAP